MLTSKSPAATSGSATPRGWSAHASLATADATISRAAKRRPKGKAGIPWPEPRLRRPKSRCRNRYCRTSSRLRAAIGAEKPIPEEIDHREIAVPVAVVDKMELLLSPEPGKAAKP